MLNWSTYNALPVLRSYASALKHFNEVIPIRGDANGTKPVGRRDQKWLAIYVRDTDKAVCIGSTWNKDKQKALLAYHPDGRVAIESHIGATCRERIQRIAGLNIQRAYNEDWVHAVAHVDGEEVIGQYPLKLGYNKPRKALFILGENQTPTYLNPTPVYKHTMNRKAKAEIMPRYKPFIDYVEVMSKLSADDTVARSQWDSETKDNPRLPMLGNNERKELGVPQHSLRWSTEGPIEFISLVESGDTESWYKAMVWLSAGHWRKLLNEAKTDIMHMVHQQHRDMLFIKERVAAGKCVQDRYGQYFR
jgi:hypothetical protein